MKYLYLISIFIISVFFISCQKDESVITTNDPVSINLGSPSEPCDLDCAEWEKCATRLINPNDFLGPTEWFCENILVKYYQTGRFEAMQTITNDNGVTITEHNHIYVGYPSGNRINLSIGDEHHGLFESYDIQISFIDSEAFNILNQSVYVPELNGNVLYQGSGYFEKNGSSASYTIEISLDYTYNNMNYHLQIIASNQRGNPHP